MTPRQRSTALGKAMHAAAEAWYRREPVAWSTYPAQVLLSGAHLLPHPERAHAAHVERAIGDAPMPAGVSEHAPPTRLDVHGVWFAGYRDLVVCAPEELARLGVSGDVALFDYKSTASIASYALTPEALAADVQCNLYALATMLEWRRDELPTRWVYFETKRKRQAAPVDVHITRKRALEVLAPAAEFARELDALERTEDAPCNTGACDDYGGCQYHKSRGGPCPATRTSLGKSIAQTKKGTKPMSPEMQAKLDALRNGGGAAASADEAPADTTASADETPAAKPAASRGRPPKATAKAPAAGGLAATMAALAEELATAENACADVRRRMSEALT